MSICCWEIGPLQYLDISLTECWDKMSKPPCAYIILTRCHAAPDDDWSRSS